MDYQATMLPAKRDELLQRFREFVNSYPFTLQGEQRLEAYAAERAAAQERYHTLIMAEQRGEDIAAQALRDLLPHANTEANRASGAWIVHGSMLAGDIRQWPGRRNAPTDWQILGAALWRFVRRCVTTPAELSQACADFANMPEVRGLQAGMLTPILHALRPDVFFPMNGSVRQVVNAFAEMHVSLRLEDYPAASAAAQQICATIDANLYRRHLPDMPSSDIFEMFAHWLVMVKRWRVTTPHRWRVNVAGGHANMEAGAIALGPVAMGDLAQLNRAEFVAQSDALIRQHPELRDQLAALWLCVHDMRDGDAIVVHRGANEICGIGIIAGPYYYVAGADRPHRLPVEWQSTTPLHIDRPGWRKPVGQIDAATLATLHEQAGISLVPPELAPALSHLVIAEAPAPYAARSEPLEGGVGNGTGPSGLPEAGWSGPSPVPEEILSVDAATFARWADIVDQKGQAIIYGPPGTGKTYLAERLAHHLAAGGGFVEIVQFHPAYTYEDFIQGLRPQTTSGGRLTYRLTPGRFLEFCRRAQGTRDRCVLIVDEINRANLAQVFGELMYLLEYRNRAIPLAGGGMLQIPANVRLIGTMNTADRSIALVDHALRRRFAFLALRPDYDALRRYHEQRGFDVEGLIVVVQRLNAEIDDPHYALGISYFLRSDLAVALPDIWRTEIEPYIEEYFFDQPAKVAAFRWDAIEAEVKGR
jgi:hypothetical protein